MYSLLFKPVLGTAFRWFRQRAGGVAGMIRPYAIGILVVAVFALLAWAMIAQWRANNLAVDVAKQAVQIKFLDGQLRSLEANTAKLLSVLADERRAVAKSQKFRKRIEESVNAVKNHDRPVGPVLQHLVEQLRRIDTETRGGSPAARISN